MTGHVTTTSAAKLRKLVKELPAETTESYGDPHPVWVNGELLLARYAQRHTGVEHFRDRVLALIDEVMA